MAKVKNLNKEVITTITAGNINPGQTKDVQNWEVKILEMLHGKKVEFVGEETPSPKIIKKGKK